MKFLLDTDHISVLQQQSGQDFKNLTGRIAQHQLVDFALSIGCDDCRWFASAACADFNHGLADRGNGPWAQFGVAHAQPHGFQQSAWTND